MLPQKIAELVRELRSKTESGCVSWHYDDDNGSVKATLNQPNIDVAILYRFDIIEEVGTFRIDIFDRSTSKDLFFNTTQMHSDFEIVRALYDSAQASGFNFSF